MNMKYYRLKNNAWGYSVSQKNVVYPENHINDFHKTIFELVTEFPNDWEEVEQPTLIDTFKFGK